jgi:hypothetical protein
MPPAVPIGFDAATVAAASFTFTTPVRAKAGDLMFAVLAAAPGHAGLAAGVADAQGWTVHASTSALGIASLFLMSREVVEGDGEITVTMQAGTLYLGAIAVYRGIDLGSAPLAGLNAVSASTSFECPSHTLTAYSDLYIGAAFVSTAATAVAPPAGTTERHEEQTGGRTLELFDYFHEATGATGTKTATTAGAQSGIAASIAFHASGVRGSGKAFKITPPGAIGLPTEGV